MEKKGQLGTLQNVVLGVVVIGFLIAIGLSLLANVQDTMVNGSTAYTATGAVVDAIADIPDWMPIIVLAFIALIVLGVIFMLQRGKQ